MCISSWTLLKDLHSLLLLHPAYDLLSSLCSPQRNYSFYLMHLVFLQETLLLFHLFFHSMSWIDSMTSQYRNCWLECPYLPAYQPQKTDMSLEIHDCSSILHLHVSFFLNQLSDLNFLEHLRSRKFEKCLPSYW